MDQLIEEHDGVRVILTENGYQLLIQGKAYMEKSYDEITFDPVDRGFICRRSMTV